MSQAYLDLRAKTKARDRRLRDKVTSLEAAAALIGDGEHVALGGCTASRTPFAMIWALVRAGRRDLTVSRS
ncbi:MAG: CoA-transferase, partial [Kiloniellales bacterium]